MTEQSLYDKLTSTARGLVLATSPKIAGTNEPDADRFRSYCAPDFQQTWGHKHFVSGKPGLQSSVSAQGFLDHQAPMAKKLKTWLVEPTDICVDVQKRKAVVRADFHMVAQGMADGEEVVNEIVYWVTMDESGEKVVSAVEFIDPAAAGALAEKMGMAPK